MPNWNHNTLTVTADDPEDLTRFVASASISDDVLRQHYQQVLDDKWVKEKPESFEAYRSTINQPLSFHSFLPEPEDIGEGWYDWRIANWGTKWDANFDGPFLALGAPGADVEATVEAQGVTRTPTVVIYKFDTAWSPPVPVIVAASEQHPHLEFTLRWGEPGMGEAGEVRCISGVVVAHESLSVEDVLAPEELWY